jgi:glycosyltransferase involved in cell wall biosynthesis
MLVRDLIRRRSRFVKLAWIYLVEKRNISQAAALHLTSNLEAVELRRFGWEIPRMAILPNGIDDPATYADGQIADDVKAIAAEQPLVLFLGRISWKKGIERLLRAFACTRAGKLAIVGTDDENLTPKLASLAASLRISHRVFLLPRTVVGAEKECLFAAARMFVLPSYSENFGNTILEAMRRGVPVTVTPEVGAAEVVRESGGGLVAKATPAELLGSAISRLVEDVNLARAMGEAGRRHVLANYTWPRIAARMEELYKNIRGNTL